MRKIVFVLFALALAGCDKLTGAAEQKIADAEAIGYACRVSQKTPEACMKENEAQSPSAVLEGWKSADKDIKEKTIDVGSATPVEAAANPPADAEKPAEGEAKPADAKEAKKEAVKKEAAKPEAHKKDAEPGKATEPAKPDQAAPAVKPAH